MSRGLFSNPKAALVFAGGTIASAVLMVGPQGGGGVLDQTVDRIGQQSEAVADEGGFAALARSDAAMEPLDPADGWGGTGNPVFGDYTEEPVVEMPEDEAAETAPGPMGAKQRALQQGDPVVGDAPGIAAPGEPVAGGQAMPRADRMVTSRKLGSQPQ